MERFGHTIHCPLCVHLLRVSVDPKNALAGLRPCADRRPDKAVHPVRKYRHMGGLVRFKPSALSTFSRDTRLLFALSGMISISFFGIQMLLKVLYVLRLGYGPEYVGWFLAASSLAFMAMGIPSGMLGNRYGLRTVMLVGGAILVIGMAMLPLAFGLYGC